LHWKLECIALVIVMVNTVVAYILIILCFKKPLGLACCNFCVHQPIFIIYGRQYIEILNAELFCLPSVMKHCHW